MSGDNVSKKRKLVEWDEECENSFQLNGMKSVRTLSRNLKSLCCETPILAYMDYQKPLRLHTDASEPGLGAIWYQTQGDGTNGVIAYASRTLSKSEKNYVVHKLEFLALKWAVTEHFHEYFYGGDFKVFTDNNPLTYLLSIAKLSATGQRWVASISSHNFILQKWQSICGS